MTGSVQPCVGTIRTGSVARAAEPVLAERRLCRQVEPTQGSTRSSR